MSICEIFPDDPTCAVAPVEEEPVVVEDEEPKEEEAAEGEAMEGEGEEGEEKDAEPEMKVDNSAAAAKAVADWTLVKDMSGFAMMDSPMAANLAFFGVAASWCVSGGLQAFRYRSDSKYYDAGEVDKGTNWWKLGDQMRNFTGLAVGGVLAVTSLMAAFGVAVGINGQAWMWLGLVGWVMDMVVGVVRFLGYDSYYTNSESKTALVAAAGIAMQGVILNDAVMDGAMNIESMMALAGAYEGFMFQQWNNTTDEEQEAKMMEWQEMIATKADEVKEARMAGGLAEGAAKDEKKDDEEEVECEEDDEECAAKKAEAAAAKEGEDAEEGDEEETTATEE